MNVAKAFEIFWHAGHKERAIALSEAYQHRQIGPTWTERQTGPTIELEKYYLDVGFQQAAYVLLDEAIHHLETAVDAGIRHPHALGHLVYTYGLRGNEEAALRALDMAVNYGWWMLLLWMEDEAYEESWKWWISLQDSSYFIQSLIRIQSIRDQQASNVRGLLTSMIWNCYWARVLKR